MASNDVDSDVRQALARGAGVGGGERQRGGRGLHSSTFQVNIRTLRGKGGIYGGIQVIFRACLGVVRGYWVLSKGVFCVRNG